MVKKGSFLSMAASTVCNFFVVFRDFSSMFSSMSTIETLKR